MTTPAGLSLTIPNTFSSAKLQRKAEEQAAAAAPPPQPISDEEPMVVDTVAGSRRIGAQDGTADVASFAGPHAVLMLPDGSLLVSDTPNNVVRRVHADAAGVRVSTLSTNRPLAAPKGLALLADGGVLVCDSGHNKLLRLDWRDGSVAPYAGSGKRGHRDGGQVKKN